MRTYKCTFCVTNLSTSLFVDNVEAPFKFIAYIILKLRNRGCTKVSKVTKVK
jgi:hypothetical protein